MTFTSRLGISDSIPGNMELGAGSASGTQTLIQSVNQFISFSDSATPHLADVPESISDTLALMQVATVSVVRVLTVNQTLGITDNVVQGNVITKSISDDLGITDSVVGGHDIHASATNTLVLVDTVRSSIINISITDDLGLTDSVDFRGPIYLSVQHSLNLSQSGDDHQNPVTQSVMDFISFTDKAGRVITAVVNHVLGLTDVGVRLNIGHDVLNLVHSVTVGKGGDASDDLDITDAAIVRGIFNRSLSDTLTFGDVATFRLDGKCYEVNYNPWVGGGMVPGYTPPSIIPPTLGHHITTLTYPFVTPTSTLVLRNPDFGNKDRLNFNRVNRETRGGTLIVFADPAWPKMQSLTLQISVLSDQQILDFKAFLIASLGKEIGLLDHENRQWRGIITNPDSPLTHVGREDRSITIEFEGELA